MFHRFHKSGEDRIGQGSVSDIEFEKIIERVSVDRILTPHEWLEKTKSGNLEPKDLCITFDDGLYSQYNVALPVLNRFGLKAFWFVFSSVFNGGVDKNEIYNRFATTHFDSFDEFADIFIKIGNFSENLFSSAAYDEYYKAMNRKAPFFTDGDFKFRYIRNFVISRERYESLMDDLIQSKGEDISELASGVWMNEENLIDIHRSGHCIGLHSYSHPSVMKNLPTDEQRKQYQNNRDHIVSLTGGSVECVAHPLNSYSTDTLEILEGLDIFCGFRSDMVQRYKTWNSPSASLEIPREDSTHLLGYI
jgi:peptidoglycan/xylan/chitin deacetylase (PgdA/CDA1 family)